MSQNSRQGPPRISISISRPDQLYAAQALSDALDQLEFNHAYIGGFAWALLGNRRPTEDIDVLIETKGVPLLDLREQLCVLDRRFVQEGIKLYFVKNFDDEVVPEEQVRKAKDNVLIETLATGTLGLPASVEPVYNVYPEDQSTGYVKILHPSICILTKLSRWSKQHTSTRPKTLFKVGADEADIQYMVHWLVVNNMSIDFEKYQGKSRLKLIKMVRQFYERYEDNSGLVDDIRHAMDERDWEELVNMGCY